MSSKAAVYQYDIYCSQRLIYEWTLGCFRVFQQQVATQLEEATNAVSLCNNNNANNNNPNPIYLDQATRPIQ